MSESREKEIPKDAELTNNEPGHQIPMPVIGLFGGLLGFILAAIGGQVARNIFPQLIFTLVLCFLTGFIWKTSIKNAWGCLFVIVIMIGIIAPVLLLFLLFSGGY